MSDLVIRPYAEGDAPSVIALILPIQQAEFGIAITAADQPDLAAIPAFYQSGAGDFLVAEQGGALVGTIGLKDIGNRQGALRKMFVSAAHRGGRPGVAAALLGALLERARTAGLAEIYLGTTEKFLAAHRFYEKHGFSAVPPGALPPAFPRMAVDTRFYRLALGAGG
ncbi:GNAT family N-acetyltransferase [Poseidonocella sp. HB161398]|uniref:GNAT family N-acetyltransferase n=1 Tax=Poseidonocella sp. HB161398 TaxID=2320855 RepID=UPI001108F0BC|nr:GNAT family N-acetyltransferase [Poseidonocella sp. HB161398]